MVHSMETLEGPDKVNMQMTFLTEGLEESPKSKSSSKGSGGFSTDSYGSRASLSVRTTHLKRYSSSNVLDAPLFDSPQHCTSCWNGRDRQEDGNDRSSLQRRNGRVMTDFGIMGNSFRSEDSENLALWEERELSGKVVSGDLGWLKPVVSQSSWRESVSAAVKKIENLSHAVVSNKEKLRSSRRGSPVQLAPGAMLESPRLSLDKKLGARSSWKDFMTSSAGRDNEAFFYNSPKARYNISSPRLIEKGEFESSLGLNLASKLSRPCVCCQLNFDSASVAKPIDYSPRTPANVEGDPSLWRTATGDTMRDSALESAVPSEESRVTSSLDMALKSVPALNKSRLAFSESCDADQVTEPKHSSNLSMPKGDQARNGETLPGYIRASNTKCEVSQEVLGRHSGANLSNVEYTTGMPETNADAAERALLRNFLKDILEPIPMSTTRCASLNRSHSIEETILNEFVCEVTEQQSRIWSTTPQEDGERKTCHKGSRRYYHRASSRERSSRWSSTDGNGLGEIDFVAPSAAKFLEDGDSPILTPVKIQGAVPFKWEEEPGKPKEVVEIATTRIQSSLRLPPRLVQWHQMHGLAPQEKLWQNRYSNKSVSSPSNELYAPSAWRALSPEIQRLPSKVQTALGSTPENVSAASESVRGSDAAKVAITEPPTTRNSSAGEVRNEVRNLSSLVACYNVEDSTAKEQSIDYAPTAELANQKKLYPSRDNRPSSPTSILFGLDDGSLPSSNPSLSSEREVPLIIPTTTSLSHSPSSSRASFDSTEQDSEVTSLESSLTSPIRCNSMAYYNSSATQNMETDQYWGTADNINPLFKFYHNGSRWMKPKANPKLGTIYSPEVWSPTMAMHNRHGEIKESITQVEDLYVAPGKNFANPSRFQHAGSSLEDRRVIIPDSEFSSRLGGRLSPLRSESPNNPGHAGQSSTQTNTRFAPTASAVLQQDSANRSPAYKATLELLSPAHKASVKNRNIQVKPSFRDSRRSTRRARVRIQVRARFLGPISKAFRRLFSRCTFRRFPKKGGEVSEPKLLYHFDYTLSPADFRFCKPN